MIEEQDGITESEAVEIYESGDPVGHAKDAAKKALREAGYDVRDNGNAFEFQADVDDAFVNRTLSKLEAAGATVETLRPQRKDKDDDLVDRIESLGEEAPQEAPEPEQTPQPLPQPISTTDQLRQIRANIEAKASQIDWQRLRQVDPGEFAAQRQEYLDAKAWVNQQEQLHAAGQQQQAMQVREYQRQQFAQYVARAAQELDRMIPSWTDPEVKSKEAPQVVEYLKKTGYTDHDISNLYDPRTIAIAHKAMKAEQKPKRRTRKPKETEDFETILKRRNISPHSVEAGALRLEALWNS